MHVQINIGLLSFQLISHQPITLSIYLQINVNKYRKNSNITSQDAQGGLDFLGFGFIILVLNCYTSSSFSVKFLIRSLAYRITLSENTFTLIQLQREAVCLTIKFGSSEIKSYY